MPEYTPQSLADLLVTMRAAVIEDERYSVEIARQANIIKARRAEGNRRSTASKVAATSGAPKATRRARTEVPQAPEKSM
jgi:hypothetical protein